MANEKIELNDDELTEVSGGRDTDYDSTYTLSLVCRICDTSLREERSSDIKTGAEKQFCEKCGCIQTCVWKVVRDDWKPLWTPIKKNPIP